MAVKLHAFFRILVFSCYTEIRSFADSGYRTNGQLSIKFINRRNSFDFQKYTFFNLRKQIRELVIDEFDDTFEEDDFELDDDLGEVPERGYTTLTPSSAKEETSEESEEKTDDAEAASQTPETDSEESDPASEEV